MRSPLTRPALALSVACLLAGCGASATPQASISATPAPSISATPTSTASATTSTAAVPAAATYTSRSFVVPFSLRLPSWLGRSPADEQSTFVTWDATDGIRKVRVMVPVSVYRPGAAQASKPPKDYTAYFLGLRSKGVRFADQTTTTIGGHPATLVTATTATSLDGVFGCPTSNMSAGDCFGFQPDLVLRMAVIDVDGHPLLVWLRANSDPKPVPDTVAPFAELLAGFRLTGGKGTTPVRSAVSTAPTALDGTWRTSYTLENLANSPLLMAEELNDDNWGTETLTFAAGKMTVSIRNARRSGTLAGRFAVTGDELTIDNAAGEHFAMRWRITGNRLVLSRDNTLGTSPTPFLVRPFTRVH